MSNKAPPCISLTKWEEELEWEFLLLEEKPKPKFLKPRLISNSGLELWEYWLEEAFKSLDRHSSIAPIVFTTDELFGYIPWWEYDLEEALRAFASPLHIQQVVKSFDLIRATVPEWEFEFHEAEHQLAAVSEEVRKLDLDIEIDKRIPQWERLFAHYWMKLKNWRPRNHRQQKAIEPQPVRFLGPQDHDFNWVVSKPSDLESMIIASRPERKIDQLSPRSLGRLGDEAWPTNKFKKRLAKASLKARIRKGTASPEGRWFVATRLWEGFVVSVRYGRERRDWREMTLPCYDQLTWSECVEQSEGNLGLAKTFFRNQSMWVVAPPKDRNRDRREIRAENSETRNGLEVNGVQKPRWMAQSEFDRRMATEFGQAILLETDIEGIGRPVNQTGKPNGNLDLKLKKGFVKYDGTRKKPTGQAAKKRRPQKTKSRRGKNKSGQEGAVPWDKLKREK